MTRAVVGCCGNNTTAELTFPPSSTLLSLPVYYKGPLSDIAPSQTPLLLLSHTHVLQFAIMADVCARDDDDAANLFSHLFRGGGGLFRGFQVRKPPSLSDLLLLLSFSDVTGNLCMTTITRAAFFLHFAL